MSQYLNKYAEKLNSFTEEQLLKEYRVLFRIQSDDTDNLSLKFDILNDWLEDNNKSLLETLQLEVALDNEEGIDDEILHALKAQNRTLGEKIRGNERIIKQLVEVIGVDLSFLGIARVEGDSMIDIGLQNGDILFYERSQKIYDGDITALNIKDKTFVKRFRIIEGKNWIYPENKNYDALCLDDINNFEILGIVKTKLSSL
jgi:phage repressor protein C with HTH and peptisase S24 domain